MKSYIKHLIECVCSLPQFENHDPIIFHKFIVFSELDENGEFIIHFAQCNHCKMIHKVTEVNESKIIKKEEMAGLETESDIRNSLPLKYQKAIENYKLDLPTLQEIKFIIDNEQWGKQIILEKEEIDSNTLSGKFLLLISENLLKIDKFLFEKELER